MTSIAGYNLNVAPCCGAHYRTPRYRSINFMAREHWTDGYRDGSLMPNDHGLRQCACGHFFLMRELEYLGEADETEEPYPGRVKPEDLPQAIAQARTPAIELAARLSYLQHLNHDYRERYRAHRETEEATTRAAWQAQNPDTRTWWQKLRKVQARPYTRPQNSPFTYPPYELTESQRDNLNALVRMQQDPDLRLDCVTRAEFHRELGQFEQAAQALKELKEDDQDVTSRLIADLIQQGETAPMRYRA